ncbi:hypothetical protein D3C85_1889650 [compost metagenome]
MRSKDQIPVNTEQAEDIIHEEEHYLPPRKVIHPSEKGKYTRIFYQTLLWLFISLVVGLTIWGLRFT